MENYTLSDIAAASGGETFGGGGAWVLIILFALIFGSGGFFGNGTNGATAADIQRAVDLNSIQRGQADIAADVQRTTYETITAVKDASYNNLSETRDLQNMVSAGNANIVNNISALAANMQNCCCETKGLIMENRYLSEKNASNIMMNDTANTQKILDAISTNRMADMQNQINALQLQAAMCGVVRYPSASTYSAGGNPFCGNGCGCNGAI